VIRNLNGKRAFTVEFVSSMCPFDNRTKIQRIRGAGESHDTRRGNAKEVRVCTCNIDMGSGDSLMSV
jgi:hypothetical protein